MRNVHTPPVAAQNPSASAQRGPPVSVVSSCGRRCAGREAGVDAVRVAMTFLWMSDPTPSYPLPVLCTSLDTLADSFPQKCCALVMDRRYLFSSYIVYTCVVRNQIAMFSFLCYMPRGSCMNWVCINLGMRGVRTRASHPHILVMRCSRLQRRALCMLRTRTLSMALEN